MKEWPTRVRTGVPPSLVTSSGTDFDVMRLWMIVLRAQKRTVELLDSYRRRHNTAIVFVTHGINPILHVTDRVLYLTPHGHTIGTVDEVMTSETLSALYRTEVKVLNVDGRLIVV